MSLDHALIVSLLEKPNTGYALARRFERSIGHFWHATHQQIYRVLARMESAGWIVAEVEPGEAAPDRKVYRVTASGRDALRAWLAEPAEVESPRSALAVKLRAAAFDDPARLATEFARQRAAHAAALQSYRDIEQRDFGGALDAQQRLQYEVLKLGIRYESNWVDWCDDASRLIHQLSAHPHEASS